MQIGKAGPPVSHISPGPTAGLLAHLAVEQKHPLGFLMAARAEEAIEYKSGLIQR